jgi:hypothetical protein
MAATTDVIHKLGKAYLEAIIEVTKENEHITQGVMFGSLGFVLSELVKYVPLDQRDKLVEEFYKTMKKAVNL